MPNFGACRCGTRWHQAGNKTGHCGACHRTFGSLDAFDAHQLIVGGKNVCRDPATLTTKAGERRFRTFVDSEGATVWRSAKVKPTDAWPARTPNPAANPPAQSRTGAGGTPEPVVSPDAPNGVTLR
jgi:hypothetical protein